MRFTEYIYIPSFNSIVLIVSEKSGCDIRTDKKDYGTLKTTD